MKGLTKRQSELLRYIEEYVDKHGFSPSYQDIMRCFGYSSPGTVYRLMQILRRKGAITSECGKARSAVPASLSASQHPIRSVPLIGTLRPPCPIETHLEQRLIDLPHSYADIEGDIYALTVEGKDLADELLAPDDILFIHPTAPPCANDTIIANLRGLGVIVRRFQAIDDYIQLESRNPNLQPIVAREDDVDILGLVLVTLRIV